jgi:hypothetical protein
MSGVWAIFVTEKGYGCRDFDSLWEDKDNALEYIAEEKLEHAYVEYVPIEDSN